MSICTCGARGEVFTSLTAFDQHQVTDYSRRLRCGAVPAACRGRAGAGPRPAAGMYR